MRPEKLHEQASGDSLFGSFPAAVAKIVGFDFGSTRGAQIPYAIANRDTTVWRRPMPLPTGAWRGLGLMANIFAVESLVDELAHAAGADPLQFRNPDGARAQIEGAIVMGTGAALLEEITVKDGRLQAGNFDRYPLLRMAEAPDVETILLEAPEGEPRGLGEPPLGPIAPAIGNALFALAGVRLRRLPMTAERVKAALGD